MNTTSNDISAERLCTIRGIPGCLRATLAVAAESLDTTPAAEPILHFVASDETIDRYSEIIAADGWKLDEYRRNPVFLDSHNYDSISRVIGTAIATEVRDGKLRQSIRFAVEDNALAEMAYGMYRRGILRAVSVGFRPIKWENGGEDENFRRRYTSQTLLEVSAVCVPANPNALMEGIRSGVISPVALSAPLSAIVAPSSAQPQSIPSAQDSATGRSDHVAQLLGSLHKLHAAMRSTH